MSSITDMLVLTGEEPRSGPIRLLNEWCRKHAEGQCFKHLPIPREASGGSKVFTTEVYLCAGNYFPWEKLIKAFPSFGWDSYSAETTALVVQDEHIERWIAVHADGRLVAPSLDANRHGGAVTIGPREPLDGVLLYFNGLYWSAQTARWGDASTATVMTYEAAGYMINLMAPAHAGICAVSATKARADE